MTDSPAPAKKAAPAAPRAAAAPPVVEPPEVDPLVEEERPKLAPFNIGDKVELTDSLAFQFGGRRTYNTGEIVGAIGSVDVDGLQIVAVKVGRTGPGIYDDVVRVEHLVAGVDSPLKKIEQD